MLCTETDKDAFAGFLDTKASPSIYHCQSVGQWLIVSDWRSLAIASLSFASLFLWLLYICSLVHHLVSSVSCTTILNSPGIQIDPIKYFNAYGNIQIGPIQVHKTHWSDRIFWYTLTHLSSAALQQPGFHKMVSIQFNKIKNINSALFDNFVSDLIQRWG